MNISNNLLNKSEAFANNNFFPSSTKVNIARHLSMYNPYTNAKNINQNILLSYINNNKLMKKENNNNIRLSNIKRGKSIQGNLNISPNKSSTHETTFSNSIFDMISPQFKNINITKDIPNKILVNLRPKSDLNKIKIDIILGNNHFLLKEKSNKRKIERFIFDTQKKFDEKMEKFKRKIIKKNQKAKNSKNLKENKNTNKVIKEIKQITKIFNKLENVISIYSLIIYYLLKTEKKEEIKLIYLLVVKRNINHIKYLEDVINFKELLQDKNGKFKINMYRYANLVLLKIYSTFIKYGFLFNLSFYGNLFMQMYLTLSHKYYLYSLIMNKNKYTTIEGIKKVKICFSYLNYYAAYFSVANYCPMKIPINLYNISLNIYNSIEEQLPEEKDFIFNTKYNKSILLYLNGESDEAINNLKDIKINLFSIVDNNSYQKGKGNNFIGKKYNKNHSFTVRDLSNPLIQKDKNNSKKNKKSLATSFGKYFENLIINTNSKYFNKHSTNINLKLEPYFVSNAPININSFIEEFLHFYGKSSSNQNGIKDQIKNSSTFTLSNKQKKQFSYSSYINQNLVQQNNPENYQKLTPKIFKNPILIKSELLIAEIELDKKHYRLAYTFINHALAIISLLKNLQNSLLLSKYDEEQKYIKEFLNIIDTTNIITESDDEESEEEEEKDKKDKDKNRRKSLKNKEYKKEIELKERINLNKKVLKELEKFFIFFMNLSLYQIKVLNETQPKTKIRNYLPILFQNQFKDCLSLRQDIALENLDVMCLNRYIILKDPNKPIYPKNLNISLAYFEKPQLIGFNYTKVKKTGKNYDKDDEDNEVNKKANEIFRQLIKAVKGKTHLQNLFNNNYDLVIKIIKNSTKSDLKEIMENPETLIQPIEKSKSKNKNPERFFKRGFIRQNSQRISNESFFAKNTLRLKTDTNKINRMSSEKFERQSFIKGLDRFVNTDRSTKNNLMLRNSVNISNFFSRNFNIKKKKALKKKNKDSYSSTYKLSLLESNSISD